MDEKKRKKRQSISISRKNVLDLGFTIGIILIACLVSSLLVHYSKSSANVTAVFTLAVLLTARVTDMGGASPPPSSAWLPSTMHLPTRFSNWILRRQVIRLFLRP